MTLRFAKLLFLILTGCALAAATIDSRPAILIVGDSLSAGFGLDADDTWATLLQTRLNEKGYGYRVVNASISGDTTGNGLRRLPRALDIHQPEIVVIELGGNDGLRGIGTDRMQSNLEKMILMSREQGASVMLVGMLIPPNYGEDYTVSFASVYPALAEQYDVALLPFFMEGVALEAEMMQPDGIHPNKRAQPILMQNVWMTLEPLLKKSAP
jgi:acyl-CoA thioesterase-1